MAMSDYHPCDVCGGKCFYDADMYERLEIGGDMSSVGSLAAICLECVKTHEAIAVSKHLRACELAVIEAAEAVDAHHWTEGEPLDGDQATAIGTLISALANLKAAKED